MESSDSLVVLKFCRKKFAYRSNKMENHCEDYENTTAFRIMGDFKHFLQSQSNVSPTNIPSIQGDSTHASNVLMRVKMKQIEAAHASSEQAHVKANIELEAKFEQLTVQNKQLKDKCDGLQAKVTTLTAKLLEMQDEVKQMSKDKENEISKWENSYLSLQTLKQEADSRVSDEIEMLSEHNEQLAEQNMALQSQNSLLTLKVEEHYTHMEQYKHRLDETLLILQDYQETKTKLAESEQQVYALRQELDSLEDAKVLAKSLREEMNQLRHMEIEFRRLTDENTRLRQNRDNCVLLQEKLHSADARLSRAEAKCAKVPALEVENDTLRQKLQQFQNGLEQRNEFAVMETEVTTLRQRLAACDDEKSSLTSELATARGQNAELNSTLGDLRQKFAEKLEVSASMNAQLLRLRKRSALLARERDSIREILQTYDSELTMNTHTTQLNKRLDNAVESNKRLHARIEELEEENKKVTEDAMMNRLRMKRIESGPQSDKPRETSPPPQAHDAELALLREKVRDYEKERVSLVEKIETLEAWIEEGKMKGDYNPENTKVIHFAMNPADLAHQKSKQEVAQLRDECIRLKQKLKEAADGHEVSMAEVESAKAAQEQLNMAELRNKRLKEVFTKKVQEFRQACYSLTGYRIDSSGDANFKLVSMYAESEEDYLLFKMHENGEMQLLESEYSKTLTDLVNLHLHHQDSIPMFLCAVSMNLFSQQTMMAE